MGPKASRGPKKPPLTHFLCIPLITTQSRPILETALTTFKSDYRTHRPADVYAKLKGNDDAAWLQAVRPVGTLHLTLGVMSLREQGKLREAATLLKELDLEKLLWEARESARHDGNNAPGPEQDAGTTSLAAGQRSGVVPSQPLKITLRALHPMQTTRSTTTLFAGPEDATERLKPFCERLKAVFTQKGYIIAEDRPLKLHATIVNTVYAKLEKRTAPEVDGLGTIQKPSKDVGKQEDENDDSSDQDNEADQHADAPRKPRRHGRQRPLKFDASVIIERYRDFEWATDVVLDRIAICEMGAKKTMDEAGNTVDEAYREVAVRALPLPT